MTELVNPFSHEYFMKQALIEAENAYKQGEIPVGAIVVSNNRIISRSHNLTEHLTDVTAHAEIMSISSAANYLNGKYLKDCTIYVTMEPCVMCAGALAWSQISKIVIGCRDEKRGFSKFSPSILHPKTEIVWDIMENECSSIVKDFFKQKR
ncbi:MAG: nucleoside deaminase [Marinifilaceae bacterium]|jgi:tRNA(adenine34) deaminase|nr:nucleoside deaminase [Marinifilaceae bacterium]